MAIVSSKRIFYIDSNNRIAGNHSDFTIQLEIGDNNYDNAVVMQVNIPKSYYLVQNGRNTFILQEGLLQSTIALPIGNYSRSSFKTQLQASLTTGSPNGWSYTVTIPNTNTTADTGHYTYNVTGNTSQPIFIVGDYLYEQLGLNQNSINNFVANSLTSVNVVNFQPKNTLYIHSDMCSNGIDNVLQEIFGVESPSFGNLVFLTPSIEGYAKEISSNKSNIYRFYLTDNDATHSIDLNGQSMSFTLMLFKKEDVYKMGKQFMKLMILDS